MQVQGAFSPERLIWYAEMVDDRRNLSQLMQVRYYTYWVGEMERAYHILGMPGMERKLLEERRLVFRRVLPRDKMVVVQGWRSRKVLRDTLTRIDHLNSSLRIVHFETGQVGVGFTASEDRAFKDFERVTELIQRTLVVTLVTEGIDYLVKGEGLGYPTSIRHLFRPGNRFYRTGRPDELKWQAEIGPYRLSISTTWADIQRMRATTGLGLLQILQLKVFEDVTRLVQETP